MSAVSKNGREATKPVQIPRNAWWQITKRVWVELSRDRVSIIAAGVAFYLMLAMVPTIGSVIAVYSMVSDPADVSEQLENLSGLVPPDGLALIDKELNQLVNREAVAGWGLAISLAITLWGASKAMDAMITALNIAYGEPDSRNFVQRKLVGLGLTLTAVLFFVFVILLIAGLPALLAATGLDSETENILFFLRWPALLFAALVGMAILYRYGPARENARWQWISTGSVIAAMIWVLASAALTWYAANFGDFSKSYGSLGAVILLLLWFYLSGFIVILGAEINAATELQTATDTSTGSPLPMGKRGAFVADHVAEIDEKPDGDDVAGPLKESVELDRKES
jgi:membrane protein